MKGNITRTLNKYKVSAYDLGEDENGVPCAVCIAQAEAEGTSMTKPEARAVLSEAIGEKLPKGLTIKAEVIGKVTYAMPLDEFLASASIMSVE